LISAERSTYLERPCGADEQLRQRVERLLKAHDHAGTSRPGTSRQKTGLPKVMFQGDTKSRNPSSSSPIAGSGH
jgi:hypothetical protein